MTNDLLLLKYELELFKGGQPVPLYELPDNPGFEEALHEALDSYYFEYLEIHVRNGPHLCLTVSFGCDAVELEKITLDQSDLSWDGMKQPIVAKIIGELQAYERQEFTYREIEI